MDRTRNKNTGLFVYRNRKLSILKCNDPMGTLLNTMNSIDGAGGTQLPGLDGHEEINRKFS